MADNSKPKAYQLHIDDSGNREYDLNQNYDNSGRHRHFVYGAILATESDASRLIARFREHKTRTFGTADVEIKSNWLRIKSERSERYLIPYGLTDDQLNAFGDGCYTILETSEVELIAVVVDKLHMQQEYKPPRQPWQAPTVAYEFLMQRVVQAVPANAAVSVTIDDIGGKNQKDHEYRTLVENHHESLRRHGSKLQPQLSFRCLAGPVKFRLSQYSDMIQLADLVAYCVFRQFRDNGEGWETPGTGALDMYPYLKRLLKRFRRGSNDRIQGYGIIKVPLITRVRWRLAEDEK